MFSLECVNDAISQHLIFKPYLYLRSSTYSPRNDDCLLSRIEFKPFQQHTTLGAARVACISLLLS